jgi:hypothetical protein
MISRLAALHLCFLASLCAAVPAVADELNAKELLPEIEKCTLKLGGQRPDIDPDAQALIVKVGRGTVGKGITAHLFYFARGKDGRQDDFGLILDATPEAVAKVLPHYAVEKSVNGYRRQLQPIGDPDESAQGQSKSVLVCKWEGA